MIHGLLITTSVLIALLSSCSGGEEPKSKKKAPQDPASNNAQGENPSETSKTGGEESTDNVALEKDCVAQWELTVKQSPVGAKFIYKSTVKTMFAPEPTPFDRMDEIKSSSPELIGHINSINSLLVAKLVPGLNGQYIEISKERFVKACKKYGTQAGAAAAVGKDVKVTEQTDETLTIDGKEIKVKKLKIEAKNLKFGTATADANAIVYISKQFPSLIIKQNLKITDSNLTILEGVEINDELKSGLPAL